MEHVFTPKRLAVVGASSRPDNLARGILSNLLRFEYEGEIFPVGRHSGAIRGIPIYDSVAKIPGAIDAAVILTPARVVIETAKSCIGHGARVLYVETAGFRELGDEGARLEQELLAAARGSGARLVGPNCIGVINAHTGLVTSFIEVNRVSPGGIAVVTQSGGYGVSLLAEFTAKNMGLSKFVSIGNKLDVDEVACLEYFSRDPQTEVICLYLEGIADGRRLAEAVARCPKPVVVHKANRGWLSQRVAMSHTAALTSDTKVVETALRQAGAVLASSINEMVRTAMALRMTPFKGRRLVAITRSGGHAVMAADTCERYDFVLPPLPERVLKEAKRRTRAHVIKLTNPMDLGDMWDQRFYFDLLDMCLSEACYDAAVFQYAHMIQDRPPFPPDILERIRDMSEKYKKPVGFCFVHNDELVANLCRKAVYPVFAGIDDAVTALAVRRGAAVGSREMGLKERPASIDTKRAAAILDGIGTHRDAPLLLGKEAYEILEAYGVPQAPWCVAGDENDAAPDACRVGYPAVLKVISPQLSHKTEAGGVVLGISSDEELRTALRAMRADVTARFPDARIQGYLVQKLVPGGIEVIVGGRRSAEFGPVVMVGLGGIYVEVMADAAMRLAPVSADEARDMVEDLKGHKLLEGVRGQAASDLDALADIIVRLGVLLADQPRISEIDLNPVKVFPEGQGALAVDARVIVE